MKRILELGLVFLLALAAMLYLATLLQPTTR